MVSETTQRVRGQSRVLVLASPTAISDANVCLDMLSTAEPRDQHVLTIAYNRRPADLVSEWEEHDESLPAEMAIVCPESQREPETDLPDRVHETHVAAGDLTGIGIAVSRYLDRWGNTDTEITACLDSLTAMLQYTDTERVFRFLHTITGRFMAAGATAHVHLDPGTQDEQTVATLSTLFDSIVRHEDGEWVVTEG